MARTALGDLVGTILADNPQSLYLFNETSGAVLNDYMKRATGTILTTSVSYAAGLGAARQLTMQVNGPTPVTLPQGTYNFTGTSPFTMETWFRPIAVPSVYARLASIEVTDGGGRQGWDLGYNTQALAGLFFERWQDNASAFINNVMYPTPGLLMHVVATYDGTNMRLYGQGALVGGPTASAQSVKSLPTRSVTFGDTQGLGSQANALFQCFAIYNYALSLARITAHWNAGKGQ